MRTIENMNREELAAAAVDAEFMRDYYLGRAKEAREITDIYMAWYDDDPDLYELLPVEAQLFTEE